VNEPSQWSILTIFGLKKPVQPGLIGSRTAACRGVRYAPLGRSVDNFTSTDPSAALGLLSSRGSTSEPGLAASEGHGFEGWLFPSSCARPSLSRALVNRVVSKQALDELRNLDDAHLLNRAVILLSNLSD
jgi:hypothetical protein